MEIDGAITIHRLEVFCLVVQLRSVTKAAERLSIAQPAVTAQLRKLEAKLGVSLFRRQGRALSLTDGGERVYQWANGIIGSSRELAQDITRLNDGLAGTVTVVSTMAIGSYRLPEVILAFQAEHPQARVISHTTNPVLATGMVRAGTCDFGVMLLDPSQRADELVVERIWMEPLFLVAKKDSRHLRGEIDIEHVIDAPFVTPVQGLVTRAMEDDLLRVQGVTRRNVVAEFGHPEAVKRALMADAAIGFVLATTIQDEIARGDIVRIDIPEFRDFAMPLFLVYRGNKVLTPLQRRLMREVRRGINDDIVLLSRAPG